jgi:hypothetical protein
LRLVQRLVYLVSGWRRDASVSLSASGSVTRRHERWRHHVGGAATVASGSAAPVRAMSCTSATSPVAILAISHRRFLRLCSIVSAQGAARHARNTSTLNYYYIRITCKAPCLHTACRRICAWEARNHPASHAHIRVDGAASATRSASAPAAPASCSGSSAQRHGSQAAGLPRFAQPRVGSRLVDHGAAPGRDRG